MSKKMKQQLSIGVLMANLKGSKWVVWVIGQNVNILKWVGRLLTLNTFVQLLILWVLNIITKIV